MLLRWAAAILEAGARAVAVVQRFPRNVTTRQAGVSFHFVADEVRLPFVSWLWNERAARTARALGPTVVHVDGMIFPALVRQLRWRLPAEVPILVQDHGGIHADSPGFRRAAWRMLHRAGLGAANGFLFTARELATPWSRAGIIDTRQRIYEVPESSTNFADESTAATSTARSLPGRPALLWVGRLDANKDPLTVLAAFERALPALPEAALSMVYGDDALLPEVRRRIAGSPALAGRVHLLGRLAPEALPPLYASADLFVLASHHESAGFALLEALSLGVTPVVTDIPAFRAITGGGALGALVPVGDADAMAYQMERLGRFDVSPDRAARRAHVRDHFANTLSWSAVGRRALAVYRAAAQLDRTY